MKRKILRLLNLRTEEDFVKQRDYYQQEVLGRIDRFNKLVKDLSEDGVDVNKYLYSFERIINVSDWDTSKVTDIGKVFSQMSTTPFDIEKKNQLRAEPPKCKYVKREGESCTLNDNCTYPNCKE